MDPLCLKEAIGKAIYDVLNELSSGEKEEEEEENHERERASAWRLAIRDVSKSSISFPNNKHSITSAEGKPHDIEIRATLTLFHKFKEKKEEEYDRTSREIRQPAKLTVVSNLGLRRTFYSPLEFAEILCPLLEEKCSAKGICHHIRSNSSGIICIVSPHRGEILRKAGKLPCPHCVHWFNGEKGLWWHQQEKHNIEHSVATTVAANQRTTLALIPYREKSCYLSHHIMPPTNESLDGDIVNDPLDFIREGNLEALKHRVQFHEYDPSVAFDHKGATPLMWAAGSGHLEIVKYLVEQCKCIPNQGQRAKRSFGGRTPLHWAARNGHFSVVEYLVNHCSVDLEAKTTDGTTAFCWASWQAHHDIMEFLYEKGANVHTTNSFGCNPVLWSSQGNGNSNIMSWMKVVGCDMYLVNSNGHGVLHKAAQRGNREIVEWMFASILDPVLQSSIDLSSERVHSCLQLIGPDADGCCPSDLAGMEGHEGLAVWLVTKEIELVQKILGSSVDKTMQILLPSWLRTSSNYDGHGVDMAWEPEGGLRRMKAGLAARRLRLLS